MPVVSNLVSPGPVGQRPGKIAPDGSPVELYLRLSSGPAPAIIDKALPRRASILDLGCGTGAVAHELRRLGHIVTGVDECAEMLEHVRVPSIRGRIEELRLPDRFDAVILASHLLNPVPPSMRLRYLRTCREHVRDDGRVLLEMHDPNAFADAPLERSCEDGVMRIYDVVQLGDNAKKATLSWTFGDRSWTQQVTVWHVGPAALDRDLAAAGLRRDGAINGEPRWVIAVPAAGTP